MLVLIGFLLQSMSFGAHRECQFDYFAFDTEHQACLKQHPAVISIEDNLNRLKSLKKSCKRCAEPFVGASQHLDLCGKNYLALNIEEHPFGGYYIDALVKGKSHAYRFWVYPIETNEFQLRAISILEFSKKFNRQMLEYAKERKYAKYWRVAKY